MSRIILFIPKNAIFSLKSYLLTNLTFVEFVHARESKFKLAFRSLNHKLFSILDIASSRLLFCLRGRR